MGFLDKYPYTNWHNVNLDWVLERVKEWGEIVEANDQAFKDLQEANESFKRYVTEYLENLDVQAQIDDKLDRMFESGELTDYLQPYVSDTVTNWLDDHITEPEGVIIDTSLTVAGAAADAKATGEAIENNSLTMTAKRALLECFYNVAWKNTENLVYYNNLKLALGVTDDVLPEGFSAVDYIYRTIGESDWTGGLNKLFKTRTYSGVTNITFEFDVMPLAASSGTKMIIGANDYYNSGNNFDGGIIFYLDTSRKRISAFSHGSALGVNDIDTMIIGEKTRVKLVPGTESPSKLYINGELKVESNWSSVNIGDARIGIFSYIGNGGNPNYTRASDNIAIGIINLYDSNDVLMARYAPCIRASDNVIGFYDTINNVFITTDDVNYATIGNVNCVYATGYWGS